MDDNLKIPDFLRRQKGEVRTAMTVPAKVFAMPISDDNWRRMEEQRKEAKKVKARGRVAKMKAVLADRAAAAAGKTWDVMTGTWK